MANVFGVNLSKDEALKRVGDISQIAGALPFEYSSGKAKGTSAVEIRKNYEVIN